MKSLNTAFSFAPPSILFLTICISVCFKNGQLRLELYHNDTIIKKEKGRVKKREFFIRPFAYSYNNSYIT